MMFQSILRVIGLLGVAGGVSAELGVPGTGKTATVDVSVTRGEPKYYASGFLNGIPENYPNQIPDKWFTGIKSQHGRSGGGEVPAPNRGWLYGFDEYRGRLKLVLDEYKTLRSVGSRFILFSSDLWGTPINDTSLFPGDDNNFDEYDKFWQQLLDDLVEYDALDGLTIELWNEPDFDGFWKRGIQQWVNTYNRYFNKTREDPRFANIPISGPTIASVPEANNTWWTTWMSQIGGNNTVPDEYAHHLLITKRPWTRDPSFTNATLSALLEQYGLPERQVNVNEYGTKSDQTPSGYAWWIARLERYDTYGLLGHYEHGALLHDLMANLITKQANATDPDATDYIAAPGWPVFNYYAECMAGQRLQTTGSTDLEFDVYATYDQDSGKVAILAGTRVSLGNYTLEVHNLDQIGLDADGQVDVTTTTYGGTDDHRAPAPEPEYLGTQTYDISNGTLVLSVNQVEKHTGWTFEFCVPK